MLIGILSINIILSAGTFSFFSFFAFFELKIVNEILLTQFPLLLESFAAIYSLEKKYKNELKDRKKKYVVIMAAVLVCNADR